ncbi:hypothetical protein OMO38_00010 [Chryseobacterium sp. 09-1422]|uniref:Uncharacterized protein n=1 Tax=Chryseobacterium kimseyorum TaxID=2984028 RepID=A0ABT3HSX9_9FLAO|nr:hypothetical protein [Chryseobacterium kimseyorum]MCW3166897.1 hypothetical protein [Chryseobacterium kimseyorum]
MLTKTTKEILLKDLLETKQLLVDAFDDKEVPFVKGGAIDQFFTARALEFQRNMILYETLKNSAPKENSTEYTTEYSPVEKIANEIADTN